MTGNPHISQEDLALHALQALSEEESAAVRTHLAQCALCRDELSGLLGVAAMVGLSVQQDPLPAGARQRLLNRIADDALGAKQTIRQERHGASLPLLWSSWIPWVVAAVLAIAAISLELKNSSLKKELRDESSQVAYLKNQSAQARRVLDLLMSGMAQRVLLTAAGTPAQPTGRVTYLADTGALVLQVSNLKQLASDKTYELWLIPLNGKPIPAGLFRPDAVGNSSVVMPPLPKGVPAKAFGVTVEEAVGSDTPTAPIIISGAAGGNTGE